MFLIPTVLISLVGWPSASEPAASRPAPTAAPKFFSAALNRLIDDPNWIPLPEVLPTAPPRQVGGWRPTAKEKQAEPLGSSFMPWLSGGSSSDSGTASSYSSESRSRRTDRESSYRSSARESSSRSRVERSSRRSDYGGYRSDNRDRTLRSIRSRASRRDDGS